MSSASAISLARRGFRRKRSITSRRVGSASAANVRSTLRCIGFRIAQALHEPPDVALGILRAVASIGPVIVAVVVGHGLAEDLGAGGPRSRAVRLDVVHEDGEAARVLALDLLRTREKLLPRFFFGVGRRGRSHHDESFAEHELAVLDSTALSLDLESHFEPECATQPVDGRSWILVINVGADARPTSGSLLHG